MHAYAAHAYAGMAELVQCTRDLLPRAEKPDEVAKQLQESPALRLHIAGHAQADEDPRLSSQRAQAVGAALRPAGAAARDQP